MVAQLVFVIYEEIWRKFWLVENKIWGKVEEKIRKFIVKNLTKTNFLYPKNLIFGYRETRSLELRNKE